MYIFFSLKPPLGSWIVHAREVFDWSTGALPDRLVEPYKQGVVPDRIHASSTRWRCSTGGLVHLSTDP